MLGKGRRRFAGLILLGLAFAVTAAPAQASPPAEKGPNRTLTVAKAGDGTGTVSSSPAGIDCGATCAATFKRRTSVTLSASPDPGSTFDGWTGGGCSGTGQCVVTLAASTTVTATFSLKPSLVVQHQGPFRDVPFAYPGLWWTSNGFVQDFYPLRVAAVDSSGDPVTSFAGTVALTSDCPLAVEGGATHAYGTADGGTHSFSYGLGDHVGFGATRGDYPTSPETAGVVCTVTATDTSGAASPGSQGIRVAGEYCDGVDNDRDYDVDEAFPEKGQAVPGGGGNYQCKPDGTGLTPSG